MLYNSDNSDLHDLAKRTSKAFDKVMKKEFKFFAGNTASKKRRYTSKTRKAVKKSVPVDQKSDFCRLLYNMDEYQLGSVIQLLDQICPKSLEKGWKNEEQDYGEEEVKIHLDLIDPETFKKAEELIKKATEKSKKKDEE